MSIIDVKKLFVWVPKAELAKLAATGETTLEAISSSNPSKVYFNEATSEIYVNGQAFGSNSELTDSLKNAVEKLSGLSIDELKGEFEIADDTISSAIAKYVRGLLSEDNIKSDNKSVTWTAKEDGTYNLQIFADEQSVSINETGKIASSLDVTYDRDSKMLYLVGKDGYKTAGFDATEFVQDGILDKARYVVATIDDSVVYKSQNVIAGHRYIVLEWTLNNASGDNIAKDPMWIDVDELFDVEYVKVDNDSVDYLTASYANDPTVEGEDHTHTEKGITIGAKIGTLGTPVYKVDEVHPENNGWQMEGGVNGLVDVNMLSVELGKISDKNSEQDALIAANTSAIEKEVTDRETAIEDAKAELIGEEGNLSSTNTIFGAKAYTDEAVKNLSISAEVDENSKKYLTASVAGVEDPDNKKINLSLNVASEIIITKGDDGTVSVTPDALTNVNAVYNYGVTVLQAADAYTDEAIKNTIESLDSTVGDVDENGDFVSTPENSTASVAQIKVVETDGKLTNAEVNIVITAEDLWEEFKA